jgi:CelD/BcsL family acetyltransferase involved in cellulose biosynthesis
MPAAEALPGAVCAVVQPAKRMIRVTASAASPEAIARYEMLAGSAIGAPPQSLAWVTAWLAAMVPDCIMLTVEEGGRPVFALALEVVAKGLFRIARFLGGTHANGNFALCDPKWLTGARGEIFGDLATALADARPDIDILALERLLPDDAGFRNPLLSLPHLRSRMFRWQSISRAGSHAWSPNRAANASSRSTGRKPANTRRRAASGERRRNQPTRSIDC